MTENSGQTHTPGPWTARQAEYHDPHFGTLDSWAVDCPAGNLLSVVGLSEEDARLIAAAPDLLVALEDVLTWVHYDEDSPEADDIGAAQAAIAKATEKEPSAS